MRYQTKASDNIIRGNCSLFVCRCCRTKFGWNHQNWCSLNSVIESVCTDCRYYDEKNQKCIHPIKKDKKQ